MGAPSDREDVRDLEDLVVYIARALVDEPDSVEVQTTEEARAIVLELSVAQDDLGKVIGREGRTARAMRAVVSAAASGMDKRVVLDILE